MVDTTSSDDVVVELQASLTEWMLTEVGIAHLAPSLRVHQSDVFFTVHRQCVAKIVVIGCIPSMIPRSRHPCFCANEANTRSIFILCLRRASASFGT